MKSPVFSVAVFDTANAFTRGYDFYATRVDPPGGASAEAAVAQAAHDVLVALFPAQQATFAAALAAALSGITPDATRDGRAVGAAVAKATLELRADDGWDRAPTVLALPSLPGYWKPTPPAFAPAAFTHYPDVLGFVIGSRDRFLMEGPPALSSAGYAADFNETKALGALDTARAYALMNMANHDAFLTSFTGKFLYGVWRPVTAIREADRDGNDATAADPAWTPLLPTPPYPGHPGNMACSTAAQAQVITRVFGRPDLPFQVSWTMPGGSPVTRAYGSIRQLADEAARSRIWGGIHFTFESLASIGSCNLLGDCTVDNLLRRR